MPRPSKGARLKLHEGKGRKPIYIDGERSVSTGCDESDREGAERFLESTSSKTDLWKSNRQKIIPMPRKIATCCRWR